MTVSTLASFLLLAAVSAAPAPAVPKEDALRIAVLVDTSQAMRPHISDMRRALRGFFKEMHGSADIALFEFGDRPARLVDYTRDPELLEAGVGRVFARPGSGAYALDAIVETARQFRMSQIGRSAIVIISGQGPEFSQRFHQQVVKDLRESNATLHTVVVTRRNAPILREDFRERELTFAEGTSATGGRQAHLLTSMALPESLTGLARALKAQ